MLSKTKSNNSQKNRKRKRKKKTKSQDYGSFLRNFEKIFFEIKCNFWNFKK